MVNWVVFLNFPSKCRNKSHWNHHRGDPGKVSSPLAHLKVQLLGFAMWKCLEKVTQIIFTLKWWSGMVKSIIFLSHFGPWIIKVWSPFFLPHMIIPPKSCWVRLAILGWENANINHQRKINKSKDGSTNQQGSAHSKESHSPSNSSVKSLALGCGVAGGEGKTIPIPSMFGIFTYIWLRFIVHVAKYTIHRSCALRLTNLFQCASRNVIDLYLDLKDKKKVSTI